MTEPRIGNAMLSAISGPKGIGRQPEFASGFYGISQNDDGRYIGKSRIIGGFFALGDPHGRADFVAAPTFRYSASNPFSNA